MPSKHKASSGDQRLTHPYMRDMEPTISWQKAKIVRTGLLKDGVYQEVSIIKDGVVTYSKTL